MCLGNVMDGILENMDLSFVRLALGSQARRKQSKRPRDPYLTSNRNSLSELTRVRTTLGVSLEEVESVEEREGTVLCWYLNGVLGRTNE